MSVQFSAFHLCCMDRTKRTKGSFYVHLFRKIYKACSLSSLVHFERSRNTLILITIVLYHRCCCCWLLLTRSLQLTAHLTVVCTICTVCFLHISAIISTTSGREHQLVLINQSN